MRALREEHGEVRLAALLAAAMIVELAVRGVSEPVISVPCAMFGCLAPALRRRSPLVAVVIAGAGFIGLIAAESA